MKVYEKARAEMVLFDNSDVITTSGEKEIGVWECTGNDGGFVGTTDKSCVSGNGAVV